MQVMENSVKMFARMIHDRDGSTHEIPYGDPGQGILSIDRRRLNEVLLTAGQSQDEGRGGGGN